MKKRVGFSLIAGIAVMGAAASVLAAGVSPFGQFGAYDKLELVIDKSPVQQRAVMIEGELYIPAESLRQLNKVAYYVDGQSYQAHMFLGGSGTSGSEDSSGRRTTSSTRIVEPGFMNNVPYDARNYHAGMMRQDVINIATLAKTLLDTSRDLENVVYSKLAFNQDPDMTQLRQRLNYRTAPFDVMEDRMDALANELGEQKGLGSKWERRMEDVIDYLDDAVKSKNKALNALEDWIDSSDKDDLKDFRKYEEDARESIGDALKILTGENIDDAKKKSENNLKDAIDQWTKDVQKNK
ncbi:MAG: hypothetical protein ACM32O_06445 [Clostridia bacterium]